MGSGRFWQVQAVLACQGDEGPGFAYTMGLASRGLPELHMRGKPSHGDDSGDDFSLSSSDLVSILDTYAAEWVEGSLRVGHTRELELVDGLTMALVSFGEAVEADELEAFGARPSKVVPLGWSLHRPSRGAPVEIMIDARSAYADDARAIAGSRTSRIPLVGASEPGAVVDFSVDGRYGPLSALVEAHALAMVAIDSTEALISHALAAEAAVNPKALIGLMATMSRLSGRDEQVREAERLAQRVMDRLGMRRTWRDTVGQIASECDMTLKRATASMHDLVGTSLRCALVAMALDDVLPDDMALAAQGAWRAAASSSGTDPGQRWRCSQHAEKVLRRAFAAFDAADLMRLSDAMVGPVESALEDDLLLVQGRAITRAVAPPPVVDMVRTSLRGLASIPPVHRQLSMFAQLVAVLVDGELTLEPARSDALRHALDFGVDGFWNAA